MERLSHTISLFREHFGAWLRVALILVVLGILFFVAGGGVSHNKKWQIHQINISGTDTLTSDIVLALVRQKIEGNYYFVYARDNSYIFPVHEIEKMLLDTFPRMLTVGVGRVDDNAISVHITERKPYALWCGELSRPELSSLPECWFIDNTGYVFDHAPLFSHGVYLETYGKLEEVNDGEPLRGVIPADRFKNENNFTTLLEKSIGKPFQSQIKPDGEYDVVIQSSLQFPFLSGVSIRFKDGVEPETLIKNISEAIAVQFPDSKALKKKLQYIDMRFGNKVIFGFE